MARFRTFAGRRLAVNHGGWPAKQKTIFDAPAMRRAARISDKLHNAIMYIHATIDGQLYDAVADKGDKASSAALDALSDAMYRVNDEAHARNALAKARELAKGGR